MWSPRRGHATAVANGSLFVIGGRSREQVWVDDTRLVGGVIDTRVASNRDHLTVRESTVLKNDVWVSHDGSGETWSLVALGCKDQQEDIIASTEIWSSDGKDPPLKIFAGSSFAMCNESSDCYGEAVCKTVEGSFNKICVCPMFGVREHHSVSVQHRYFTKEDTTTFSEDYIYLIGGFTHVRQKFCDGRACSSRGSYRVALDDAWVTNNGVSWVQIRPALGNDIYKARGGHSSALVHANLFRKQTVDKLWIFGGESVSPDSTSSDYLNDVWIVDLATQPCCAKNMNCDSYPHHLSEGDTQHCLPNFADWGRDALHAPWNGRVGHVTIHEPPSSLNAFVDYIYLVGGKNESSTHSDVWSLDASSDISWQLDYAVSPGLLPSNTRSAVKAMTSNPHQFYFDMNSTLTSLVRSRLPLTKRMDDEVFVSPSAITIIGREDVARLEDAGLTTLTDLSRSKQRTILKLRGFDFPGTEKNIVQDICYLKALVHSFEIKCSVQMKKDTKLGSCQALDTTEECIAQEWDGCNTIEGYSYINIHGLGTVTVPADKPDTSDDLENMYCKQTPGPRYMSAGQYIDGNVILLGGQGASSTELHQDVWSRDNSAPIARIKMKPKSQSSQSKFLFECDEDGALQFEYKLFDLTERLDVTPWLSAMKDDIVDFSWLDTKKGGPGSGWYTLYLRAGEFYYSYSTMRL